MNHFYSFLSKKCLPVQRLWLFLLVWFGGIELGQAQIAGIVYRDYNASGVKDPNEKGIVGAIVNAYNAAGQLVGTATVQTIAGTYQIPNVSGKLRVEFVNLGESLWDSPVGLQNATSIQFVTAPNINVNLGLNRPNDFYKGVPSMITICYRAGAHKDFSGDPALVNVPYFNSGDSSTTAYSIAYDSPMGHSLAVPIAKLGCLWGLCYDRVTAKIYASAFMKRHSGYGPNGAGAIYMSDTVGTDASLLVDLNAIFGANTTGPDLHNLEKDHFRDYKEGNGLTTIDAVSKTSLGGLAISPDGKFLYAMNLYDRQLYVIPVANPTAATIKRIPIPIPTGTKNPDDLRPFAVEQYLGTVYVGMVNSAESTQDSTDLKGYIYTFDSKSNTFSNEPFFQMNLNYERGRATPGVPQQIAAWRPWAKGFRAIPANVGDFNWKYPVYPQPILVGLDFSDDGDLLIGFRDRYGDQMGNIVRSNPANNEYYSGVSTGDILIASKKNGVWVLENNGDVGEKQSYHGQNIGSGPGGGEFFCDDYYVPFQNEISTGGVKVLPGTGEVVVGCIDPIMVPNNAYIGGSSSGGLRWFSTEDGHYRRGYRLFGPGYGGKDVVADSLSLGKSASLGDIELIADPGPLEIGNRIWRDTDGDGIQDADEEGIANVVVELWKNNVKIATETTNDKGEYYFHSFKWKDLTRFSDVELRVDTTQSPLKGLHLTRKDAGNNDAIDSDAKAAGQSAVILHQTSDLGANDHRLDMGFHLCPIITKIVASSPVCVNQPINLALQGSFLTSYSWVGPGGFSSTQQSPQVAQATTGSAGTYSVTVGNEGCPATATVSVQVKSLTLVAQANSPVCQDANLVLASYLANQYSWSGPNGFVSTQRSPVINANNISEKTAGVYTVSATSSDGCTASNTVSVYVMLSSASIAVKPVTCTGNVSNEDGQLLIIGAKPTDRYAFSAGTTYVGSKNYSTAIAVPNNGILTANLPNPTGSQSYTVRIFLSSDCYIDRTVLLKHQECICPPPKCVPFDVQKTNK
ncbi:MAG: SdrD B-like domain-containing protein [Spirosomataceae bacterium]